MSALLDELRTMHCDIDGAMGRFLNNEEFYTRCLQKMLQDPSFAALGEALKKQETETAFHHAHTLKGVIANMGITPLYNLVVQIVEPLREGTCSTDLWTLYEAVIQEKAKYQVLLEKLGI